jgi:hypothetical protein
MSSPGSFEYGDPRLLTLADPEQRPASGVYGRGVFNSMRLAGSLDKLL